MLLPLSFLRAQTDTLVVDTVHLVPCQQKVVTTATVIVAAGDSVTYSKVFSFNANGTPLFVVDTTVASAGTTTITDTFSFATPATYWVGYRVIRCDTSGCDTFLTPLTQVVVTPACIVPSVAYAGPGIASLNGGVQPLQYNAGNDSAEVKVYVSFGDTTFTSPFFAGSYWVTGGASTGSYNFSGYPSGYYFSYKFVITNSLGSDTTGKRWIQTLVAPAAPWVSNYPDSLIVGQDSVDAYWSLLTNGLSTTVTGQWKVNGAGVWTNLPLGIFTGNAGANAVNFSLSGLTANTTYQMRVYASNSSGSDTSLVYTVTTNPIPVMFSLSIDTSYVLNGNTEHIIGTATVPGASATAYWILTTFNDSNYVNVLSNSTLASFTGGVWQGVFDATPLTAGGHYRVSLVGVSGATIVSVGDVEYTFIFMGTPPTVDNVVFSNITPSAATATVTATTLAAGTVQVKWGTSSGNYSNTLPTQNILTGTNNKIFNFVGLPYHDTVFVQVTVLTIVSGLTDTVWTLFVTTDTSTISLSPPIISNTYTANISATSADVGCIVDGQGYVTNTTCEWGTSFGVYPNFVSSQSGGMGSSGINFSIVALPSNTQVFVRLIANNGNGADTAYFDFTTQIVGVEEETSIVVTIFPNPTTDFFYISGYEKEIQLVNMQGKVVLQARNAFDVRSIPEGVYFLIFKNEQSRKVIVQK